MKEGVDREFNQQKLFDAHTEGEFMSITYLLSYISILITFLENFHLFPF